MPHSKPLRSFARRYEPLSPDIEVLPGTDLDDVWNRFEVFEALHHSMQICNPMTSEQVDEVVERLPLSDGTRMLDVACGYGEMMMRYVELAEQKALRVECTGIDLSPWMITGAHELAKDRVPNAGLRWVIGEARDYRLDHVPDIALCVGAEWIWHDFKGTVRALSHRLEPGGVAVVGAPRLHHNADKAAVAAEWGYVETIDDMESHLRAFNFESLHRVDPTDQAWDDYLDRTAVAVADHPDWAHEQADWQAARERDRDLIGWSVWIARLGGST